jgi:orotidine-5'-phosphate decarboxylase
MPTFQDRLARDIDAKRSLVCVGLDPVLENIPSAIRARHHEPLRAIAEFCCAVIDATADAAALLKPQSACFERFGSRGVAVLEEVIAHARAKKLLVLLDAKRGDIGISAAHYAAAAVHMGADAITANAYLGPSTIQPYLEAGLGVFALVRTSNPDSDAVQSQSLADGRTVAQMMADLVQSLPGVGCVVGATKSLDASALRERMPDRMFLIPGYGAQGGTLEDLRHMLRPMPEGTANSLASAGIIVNASRSIIYPTPASTEESVWRAAVRLAATQMQADLARLRTMESNRV